MVWLVPSRLKVWSAKMGCIYIYIYIYTQYIHIWLRFSDAFTIFYQLKIYKINWFFSREHWDLTSWGHGAVGSPLSGFTFVDQQWLRTDQDISRSGTMGVWKPRILSIWVAWTSIQHLFNQLFLLLPAGTRLLTPFIIFIIRNTLPEFNIAIENGHL